MAWIGEIGIGRQGVDGRGGDRCGTAGNGRKGEDGTGIDRMGTVWQGRHVMAG